MNDIIFSVIAGIAASAAIPWLVTILRKSLDHVHTRLSVEGKSVDVDPERLDELKQFVLSMIAEPQVFIAYSFQDKAVARRLADDLKHHGIRVWLAEDELRPGDNIAKRIEEGLLTSGYLLALLSRASVSSPWVQREFSMALSRESQGKWPRVIPVLIEHVAVPPLIQDKLYVDLATDYDAGLGSIVDSIKNTSCVNKERKGRVGP